MTTTRRVLPYGDRAVLVEPGAGDDLAALARAIDTLPAPGIVDVVPAACTVLVVVDPRLTEPRVITDLVLGLAPAPAPADGVAHDGAATDADLVVIDVVYDGDDLDLVAAHAGIDVAEVIRRHEASRYRSRFCGFAPGFAYLSGGDPCLTVPRLATPRTRVPAGSVALAAGWCGVYPREMPGGWMLIGRTDAPLWDLTRERPALLAPGTNVRFRRRAG